MNARTSVAICLSALLALFALIQLPVNRAQAGTVASCDPAPVGLVAWWTADGNMLDGRSRHNGTPAGNVPFVAGKVGQAFSFDGTSNIDTGGWQPGSSWTLETWVNPASLQSGRHSFLGGAAGCADWAIGFDDSQFVARIKPPGQCTGTISAGFTATPGTWYHVAVTNDGSTARIYVDGVLRTSGPVEANYTPTASGTRIGNEVCCGNNFAGLVDEPAVYDRALSAAEISALFNAGTSGKCRPTATIEPSFVAGWWPGDGTSNDLSSNANSGTLSNGAAFVVGKVGQGFIFDGNDDVMTVPNNFVYNAGEAGLSGEAWIFPRTVGNAAPRIFDLDENNGNNRWLFALLPNAETGGSGARLHLNVNGVTVSSPDGSIPLNQWSHVAFTYEEFSSPTQGHAVLYLNGNAIASSDLGDQSTSVSVPLRIGNDSTGTRGFNGYIDEPTLYDHVLTTAEVQSLSNAGLAGKLKSKFTSLAPPPSPNRKMALRGSKLRMAVGSDGITGPVVTVGDATVTFNGGSGNGQTQEIPLPLAQLPPVPFPSVGLTYDVSTSFAYAGSPSVCFKLPAFLAAQFPSLRVYHLEGGIWVNRTAPSNAYPDLCTTSLPSLSPFAITLNAPTAAEVAVSGRVTTSTGIAVRGATVTMTDAAGVARSTTTNAFGYYSFDGVVSGQAYVVGVSAKRYRFTSRLVTVADTLSDLDFIADQ